MSGRFHHRLPFGAELVAPDRTRFRVWAPSCSTVAVVLEDDGREVPMNPVGDGWFEVETDCGAGTRYKYRFAPTEGDAIATADPASRLQAGDVHDASIVVDPNAYAWRNVEWRGRPWSETVIWEAHVGLLGGFAGVRKILPDLARLGVTAIELMPINDFAGARNWGYDGVLPFAPDTAYGTPDELKALVDAAHDHGLMVFLDVVYNHFGPDGNYLGAFAHAFFRDDVQTPWGRAIDFRRAEVQQFFCENARYWLDEYRLDGLRFDALHAIVPQAWLEELATCIAPSIEGRHVHLVMEHEDNAAHLIGPDNGFDAQWNDDCHHVLHVMLTGESDGYYGDFADDPADKLARCLSDGFIYQGQPSPLRNGEPRGEPSDALPPTAFVSCLQNHDQIGNRAFGDRLTTLAKPEALEAATALLLLSPQIPLIFMGEERGAKEPFLFFTGFPGEELAEAVRQGRRKEFANAPGFANPKVREEIPDPNDPATFERCRVTEPFSGDAFERMQRLLALRREHVAPRLDGARSLGAEVLGPKAVVARWRLNDGSTLTIAINLADDAVVVDAERLAPRGERIHATGSAASGAGTLPGPSTQVWLERSA